MLVARGGRKETLERNQKNKLMKGGKDTHLDQSDEYDEQRRRTTRIIVSVIFTVAVVRQELVGYNLDHSVQHTYKEINYK